ncbi:MAG: acylphosphatase, partial [Acidimicrobiales bacterium]
ATLAEVARDLGVDGWVKNRPDGCVEAVLEGERKKVEKVLEWGRKGPPRARVDGFDVSDEEPSGESGFFVR